MLELLHASVYSAKEHAFVRRRVVIEKDRIEALDTAATPTLGAQALDLEGYLMIPGLIDLHLHGAAGVDTMEGTLQAFVRLSAYEASCGVTSIVPTTMTMPFDQLQKVCSCVSDLSLPANCARVLGLYLEGPCLNPRRCGAQNQAYLQVPELEPLLDLDRRSGHRLKFVALSPELPGALEVIAGLKAQHIRTTLAHTDCTYGQALEAIRAGADHVTHLYNAMPPFLHRMPGPIGACMDAGSECELICDGYHLSGAAVRAAFRLMREDRICFISDSMMATGLADGTYQLGGQPVEVSNRRATLADGTLAGSATNLFDCLRTAVKTMAIPLEDAVRACTCNPARSLGESTLGTLAPGACADLLVIDRDLQLHGIMLRGAWLKKPDCKPL